MSVGFRSLSVAVLVAASGSALGQVITIQSQNRFIDGVATLTDQGVPITDGPYHFEPPTGDYGSWTSTLSATAANPNASMHTDGNQTGGFNGSDTIELFQMQMNFSGGGGPGISGTATLTNTFGYTFTVNEAANFTLNGLFGSGLPVVVTFDLTGPGVDIHGTSATGTVEYQNVTGAMVPGTYVLKLEGTGTIAFTGPGGNGSGAGGNQPLLTLVVTPSGGGCYPDCDGIGGLTANDFSCFLNAYAGGQSYANCDGVGGLTANDFACFLNSYAAGCS